MSLNITANSLISKYFLMVDSDGVKYSDGTGFASAKRFQFSQIESVLMSPDNKLSFQVGNEVFAIPTKPDNAKHKEAIDALLQELRRTLTTGIS